MVGKFSDQRVSAHNGPVISVRDRRQRANAQAQQSDLEEKFALRVVRPCDKEYLSGAKDVPEDHDIFATFTDALG
jgi:hypothetical protein